MLISAHRAQAIMISSSTLATAIQVALGRPDANTTAAAKAKAAVQNKEDAAQSEHNAPDTPTPSTKVTLDLSSLRKSLTYHAPTASTASDSTNSGLLQTLNKVGANSSAQRKASARTRLMQLKARIEAMQKFAVGLSPQAAKGMARLLKAMAQELKSAAADLAGGDDASPAPDVSTALPAAPAAATASPSTTDNSTSTLVADASGNVSADSARNAAADSSAVATASVGADSTADGSDALAAAPDSAANAMPDTATTDNTAADSTPADNSDAAAAAQIADSAEAAAATPDGNAAPATGSAPGQPADANGNPTDKTNDKTSKPADQAAVASAQAAAASASTTAATSSTPLNVKVQNTGLGPIGPSDQALVQEVANRLKALVALVAMLVHQKNGKNKDVEDANAAIEDAQRSAGSNIQDAVSIPDISVNVATSDSAS